MKRFALLFLAAAAAYGGNAPWKQFGDPLLDELLARAAAANLDIRLAGARLAETEASRSGSRAALLPEFQSTTSATRLRGGFNQGVVRATPGSSFISAFETSVISSGFSMRWEADVYGGRRKGLKAADADARAAALNVHDMQMIVRAAVARSYIEMRGAEQQIAIVRADAASERDMLDLVRARADAGLASDLDVERQAAQLASVEAAVPDLDAQRLLAIHRIGVLLGEPPPAWKDRLEAHAAALQIPPPPGAVSGEVLRDRPDVRRAEAEIAAAYARVGEARADLYPKFVITGLTGRQSSDVAGLTLGAGNFFSVGPGITIPLFQLGKIRSQIAARNAQLDAARTAYEQEILAAYEEAENAYIARDRSQQKRAEIDKGLGAARRAVELAQELYTRGLSDFLAVLDARRQQFQFERDLAAADTAVLGQTVALYKALGEF